MNENYAEAANKYAPHNGTRILFIAEAPPNEIERYFYFENVKDKDWLWRALMKGLYTECWEKGRTREHRRIKSEWLKKFQTSGYRLIDALKPPVPDSHEQRVQAIKEVETKLIEEVKSIDPKCIVLIKKSVFEALYEPMCATNLNVINNEMLPFPSSGWQTEFHNKFKELNLASCSQEVR
jgi:hypothetical protein